MDYAQVLVRSVARTFYETEHVVIIDALVRHSALSLSDLAVVMESGKQVKTIQKLCARLREAGLVSVHARQETREGAQKPITREYFYIDYRRAIDATKYRIHMLDEEIKREARPTTEKKEYICKQCESQWTLMEVLDTPDPSGSGSGFLCKKCGFALELRHEEDAAAEADDRPAMFNKQFGHLLTLLQRIDNSVVPEVRGEDALAEAVPVPRDEMINPAMKTTVGSDPFVKPAAVRGITTGPENIEISITTNSETNAAEQAAAAAHKERIAKQNQLPVWHTQSTVTGSAPATGQADGTTPSGKDSDSAFKAYGDDGGEDMRDPTLDAYFEQLKAEQERQALKEAEEDEDDEDEDEDDEFEDVPTTNGAPSAGPELDDSEREAKRVKIESPPDVKAEEKAGDDEESDADDFEDAL